MINIKFINLTYFLPLFFATGLHSKEQTVTGNQLPQTLHVYKTPTCGCCKTWVNHIKHQGFEVNTTEFDDLTEIKDKYKIRPKFLSCHTALSKNGYVFEGHIPAKFIQQFLAEEPPNAIGLSVPAMPIGSPGMEVGERFMPYQVLILLTDGSSKVYAQVKSYKEQF